MGETRRAKGRLRASIQEPAAAIANGFDRTVHDDLVDLAPRRVSQFDAPHKRTVDHESGRRQWRGPSVRLVGERRQTVHDVAMANLDPLWRYFAPHKTGTMSLCFSATAFAIEGVLPKCTADPKTSDEARWRTVQFAAAVVPGEDRSHFDRIQIE